MHASTGLGKTTIWRWLQDLHEAGEIHISGWVRVVNGGPPMAVYAAGPGKDKVCRLKPLTNAEKCRNYRLRYQQAGELEILQAKSRARYWAAKHKQSRQDPLLAALFGKAA